MEIFLVESETLFRCGLRALLEEQGNHQVVGEASCLSGALSALESRECNLILSDGMSADNKAKAGIRKFKEKRPDLPLLIVSSHCHQEAVKQAFASGADGYLPKSAQPEELLTAIEIVGEGGCFIHSRVAPLLVSDLRAPTPAPTFSNHRMDDLSPRETELLRLLVQGLRNHEIAEALFVSVSTVKNHLRHLFKRFGVSDRTSLVVEALNQGHIAQAV